MTRWLLFLAMALTFSVLTLALASAAGVLDSREGCIVIGVAVFQERHRRPMPYPAPAPSMKSGDSAREMAGAPQARPARHRPLASSAPAGNPAPPCRFGSRRQAGTPRAHRRFTPTAAGLI